MCDDFSNLIQNEFEMSMMEELGFFLGLQIKQHQNRIFINKKQYVKGILKKYKMNEEKIMVTPCIYHQVEIEMKLENQFQKKNTKAW